MSTLQQRNLHLESILGRLGDIILENKGVEVNCLFNSLKASYDIGEDKIYTHFNTHCSHILNKGLCMIIRINSRVTIF